MKLAVCCLSATLLTSAVAGDIKLVWDANPPQDLVQAYVVYDRVGSNVVRLAISSTNSITLKGMAAGPHCFSVTATNDVGESGHSIEVCANLPSGSLQGTDTVPPVSSMASLPAQSYFAFPVSWSGQDETGGSGLASFEVYVSQNSQPYKLWLAGVTNRQDMFIGELGSSYRFFALATDSAGNKNLFPPGPQTQTTVALVNTAPMLQSVSAQRTKVGDLLVITNRAIDIDLPRQKLRYEIGMNGVHNAMINPDTGVLVWKAGLEEASRTVFIEVNVFDDGVPAFSHNQRITVNVEDYAQVRMGTNIVESGHAALLPITVFSSVPMSEFSFILHAPNTHVSSVDLSPVSGDVCSKLVTDEGGSMWVVWFRLCGALRQAGTRYIGDIALQTIPGSIGIAPVHCYEATALRSDGTQFPKVGSCGGRTILIAEAPVLELVQDVGRRGVLTIYGMPGVPYIIETRRISSSPTLPWQFFRSVTMPANMVQPFTDLPLDQPQWYYRAQIDPDYIPARR